MALKPDRIALADGSRMKWFMNETAERGGIVCSVAPGGNGMDDPDSKVHVPAGATGAPVGVLMNDVVNLNLNRQHLNQHKDEVQIGNKVSILQRGFVTTDVVATGITPVAGQAAYYTTGGEFTNATGSAQVGYFASGKDSDGYAEIEINIVMMDAHLYSIT